MKRNWEAFFFALVAAGFALHIGQLAWALDEMSTWHPLVRAERYRFGIDMLWVLLGLAGVLVYVSVGLLVAWWRERHQA